MSSVLLSHAAHLRARNGKRIKLSAVEKSWHSQVCELVNAEVPFWILESGGPDGKDSHREEAQRLVDRFRAKVLFIEVAEERDQRNPLQNVLNLRGQTDPRQLVRLIYHAQGLVCTTAKLRALAQSVEANQRVGPSRPCLSLDNGHASERINAWLQKNPKKLLSRSQSQMVESALLRQRNHTFAAAAPAAPPAFERVFAAVCDAPYYPGLKALLNSIATYQGCGIPFFLYHRELGEQQLCELRAHPIKVHLFKLSELPFPSPGMWEAKQQVFAHAIGRARCVYLLDADLVLVSAVHDVFELASSGKIVGSSDGHPVGYGSGYEVYHPELPGCSQAYINSGALCLDVVRHWDLAGLWAFSAQYGAYTSGGGTPLSLPGHGDQGMFNAVAGVLRKAQYFHVLPEGTWCDSTQGCALRIQGRSSNGRIKVWNITEQARQRLVHSSGPKWWTREGAAYLRRFGDKLQCFEHFARLKPNIRRAGRGTGRGPWSIGKAKARVLVGICSCTGADARRSAVRRTWLKGLPQGMTAVFFVGAGPAVDKADVVQLPVQDDYCALPQKVQALFRYALERYDFDYLFKCDDDTYVCAERLLALAGEGGDYVGSTAWAAQGYASGGAGYLLSARSVAVVAGARPAGRGAEDLWVGQVLGDQGIRLQPTARLQMDHRNLPGPRNQLISAHWCSAELMDIIEQGFRTPGSTDPLLTLFAQHPHWEGPLKLLRNGTFLGGAQSPHGRWSSKERGKTLVLEWFHWPKEVLCRTRYGFLGPSLRLELARNESPAEMAGARSR